MPYAPREIVIVQSLTNSPGRARVHRHGEWESGGNFVELIGPDQDKRLVWVSKCGQARIAHLRVDEKGHGVAGGFHDLAVRLWAFQAVLLSLPFCRRCFPPEDRPDDPARP